MCIITSYNRHIDLLGIDKSSQQSERKQLQNGKQYQVYWFRLNGCAHYLAAGPKDKQDGPRYLYVFVDFSGLFFTAGVSSIGHCLCSSLLCHSYVILYFERAEPARLYVVILHRMSAIGTAGAFYQCFGIFECAQRLAYRPVCFQVDEPHRLCVHPPYQSPKLPSLTQALGKHLARVSRYRPRIAHNFR